MATPSSVDELPQCAAVTLTAAQASVIAKALVDAERYRRDSAAMWCAGCEATQGGACPDHVAFLAPAVAYRELAVELAYQTNAPGRSVRSTTAGLSQSRYHEKGNLP